jgi:hypothetical protein
MRHRHHTKHRVAIDDDEFVFLNPQYPRLVNKQMISPLQKLIDDVGGKYGGVEYVRGWNN